MKDLGTSSLSNSSIIWRKLASQVPVASAKQLSTSWLARSATVVVFRFGAQKEEQPWERRLDQGCIYQQRCICIPGCSFWGRSGTALVPTSRHSIITSDDDNDSDAAASDVCEVCLIAAMDVALVPYSMWPFTVLHEVYEHCCTNVVQMLNVCPICRTELQLKQSVNLLTGCINVHVYVLREIRPTVYFWCFFLNTNTRWHVGPYANHFEG